MQRGRLLALPFALLLLASPSLQEIEVAEDSPPLGSDPLKVVSVSAGAQSKAPPDSPAVEQPSDEAELLALMRGLKKYRFRENSGFGADAEDLSSVEISLASFDEIHCCDGREVYVGAAVTYEALVAELKAHKFALENVPRSVHARVVSSVINAETSSFFYGGLLAQDLLELVVLMPDGRKRHFTPRDSEFASLALNFGFAGAVIGARLKVVPEFSALKCIFQDLRHEDFVRKLHLMFFGKDYAWYFLDPASLLWEVHHVYRDDSGFRKEGRPLTPVCANVFINGSRRFETALEFGPELQVPTSKRGHGPWDEKLFLFPPETPAGVLKSLYETKYFVEYNQILKALRELLRLPEEIKQLMALVGLGHVQKDDFLMSPTQGRTSIALSIFWKGGAEGRRRAVREFEKVFQGHIAGADLTSRIELSGKDVQKIYGSRVALFERMARVADPFGKLRSSAFDRFFGAGELLGDL